jgi:hypothetical protein
MADCWHPIAQQQLTTLKKEDQRTPKGTGSYNQQEAKPSLNLQIEKQLTMGRMGRTVCSSTLPIPGPEVSMWLKAPFLCVIGSSKSCFPTHTGTLYTPPTTQSATFTLKCQGNQHPCVRRVNGSAAPQVTELTSQQTWFSQAGSRSSRLCSWKPWLTIRPQNSHRLQAWFPQASSSYHGSW